MALLAEQAVRQKVAAVESSGQVESFPSGGNSPVVGGNTDVAEITASVRKRPERRRKVTAKTGNSGEENDIGRRSGQKMLDDEGFVSDVPAGFEQTVDPGRRSRRRTTGSVSNEQAQQVVDERPAKRRRRTSLPEPSTATGSGVASTECRRTKSGNAEFLSI